MLFFGLIGLVAFNFLLWYEVHILKDELDDIYVGLLRDDQ